MQSFAMRAWVGALVLFLMLLLASPFIITPSAHGETEATLASVQHSPLQEDQSFCDALLWPEQDDQCHSAEFVANKAVTHNFLDTYKVPSRLLSKLKELKSPKSVL